MNPFLETVRYLPPRSRPGGTITLMCFVMIAEKARAGSPFDPLLALRDAGFTAAEISDFAADAWAIAGDVEVLVADAADRPRKEIAA
jgi:hypothetical protein